jgi:hypothetical protein
MFKKCYGITTHRVQAFGEKARDGRAKRQTVPMTRAKKTRHTLDIRRIQNPFVTETREHFSKNSDTRQVFSLSVKYFTKNS